MQAGYKYPVGTVIFCTDIQQCRAIKYADIPNYLAFNIFVLELNEKQIRKIHYDIHGGSFLIWYADGSLDEVGSIPSLGNMITEVQSSNNYYPLNVYIGDVNDEYEGSISVLRNNGVSITLGDDGIYYRAGYYDIYDLDAILFGGVKLSSNYQKNIPSYIMSFDNLTDSILITFGY